MSSGLGSEDIVSINNTLQSIILLDNDEAIEDILNSLNLPQMSSSLIMNYFGKLISLCLTNNSKKCGRFIYNYWDNNLYSATENVSFYAFLFLHSHINTDMLTFLDDILSDEHHFTLLEILTDLMEYYKDSESNTDVSDGEYQLACDRLIKIYGMPTIDNLEYYRDLTYDDANPLSEFFGNILRRIGRFADIPYHMINKNNVGKEYNPEEEYDQYSGNPLPKESDVKIDVETSTENFTGDPKTLVKLILSNVDVSIVANKDISSDESVEAYSELERNLTEMLTQLTIENRLILVNKYLNIKKLELLQQDIELFRILGPSAPIKNSDEEMMEYGGERMLISNAVYFEQDDDSMETDADWFKGYCQQCDLRIRRKYHAVRVPVDFGGWYGCYCSWYCVRDYILTYNFPNAVSLKLADKYEAEINSYGIYDRIPDAEYDEYLNEYYSSKIKKVIGDNLKLEGNVTIMYFYQKVNGVLCNGCEEFENEMLEFEDFSRIIPINVDDPDINLDEYSITLVPTFLIYKGNTVVDSQAGYSHDTLLNLVKYLNKV